MQTVDTFSGEITGDIRGYGGYVVDIAFVGDRIFAINSEGQVFSFQQETFAPISWHQDCQMLAYQEESDKAICFYPYTYLQIQYWRTREIIVSIPLDVEQWIAAAAFHPNGEQIATIELNGTIAIWDAITGELERTLVQEEGIPDYVSLNLAYLQEGRYLAAGKSGTIWDVETGEIVVQPDVEASWHGTIIFSEVGDWYAQSLDSNLYIWRLSKLLSGEVANKDTALATLPSQLENSASNDSSEPNYDVVAASPDGRLLAAHTNNGFALFDMETFNLIYNLPDDRSIGSYRNNLICFSADGRLLIIGDGYCFGCGADESLQIGNAQVWAVEGG